MAKINDGGPAFPMLWNAGHNSDWQVVDGMTLRAYFAGQVINGMSAELVRMMASDSASVEEFARGVSGIAAIAVKAADALIVELAKDPSTAAATTPLLKEAVAALQLHVDYNSLPSDRGGAQGPKGQAAAKFIKARDDVLSRAKEHSDDR